MIMRVFMLFALQMPPGIYIVVSDETNHILILFEFCPQSHIGVAVYLKTNGLYDLVNV